METIAKFIPKIYCFEGHRKITEQSFSISWQCTSQIDNALILPSRAMHTGDRLNAPPSPSPSTSISLRMSNETIRVAVELRLGAKLCKPHQCICGTLFDARGLHGLSCQRSVGIQATHSLSNYTIWCAMNKAGVQSTKEPIGFPRSKGIWPDSVTSIP